MYEFTEVLAGGSSEEKELPESDSIYIYDIDKSLKEILPHVRVLSAEGRSNQTLKLNTAEKSGDGVIFLNKKYNPITITLKARLTATDIDDYNRHIEAIYNNLQGNQFKFSFLDEKDGGWYRYGTVNDVKVEAGTLTPDIQISIYCSDPFKRKIKNDNKPLKEEERYTSADWFDYGIKEHNSLYQPQKIVINYKIDSSVTRDGVVIDACDSNGNVIKTIKTLPYSEIREDNTIEITFKSDSGEYLQINGYLGNKIIDIYSNISDFGVPRDGYIVMRNDDVEAYAVCEVRMLG